ncbi:CDP-diacylglycerol--glycerol-3-phosphate 3-phosphatidyltransferase [Alloscardovia venturai]|uniref:CDP-diacylglycerol--glycerol-3-phosphate 3-phosphatidyltransferase n=1 Tax=Alloscardovia venturai TaxID=1769421 RepID=A0ABW2Y6B4_9BIFI
MAEKKKFSFEGWNNAPNIVTYIRIIMMFAFMYFAIAAGTFGLRNTAFRWVAGILFIIAATTDKLDGYLARKYNQVTDIGKLMDPIADKLLILSAFFILSAFGEIWWWVTILFAIREIGITIMRFFVIDAGGRVIAASHAGKLKTLTQCIGLGMLTLPLWSVLPGNMNGLGWKIYYWAGVAIVLIALFFCLYSGAEYLVNTFGPRVQSKGDK